MAHSMHSITTASPLFLQCFFMCHVDTSGVWKRTPKWVKFCNLLPDSDRFIERVYEMGFVSQKIERSELVAGDHIYTWRAAFTYSHHGIYIGESKVVHFAGTFGSSSYPFPWSSFGFSASTLNPLSACNFPNCGFRHPNSGVVLSCLDCFLANGSLYRFEYGVSKSKLLFKLRGGTCTTAESHPPELVIHKAMYLLEHGFGEYSVMRNNCEHFAMYCKTGLVCIIGGSGQAFVFQVPFLASGTCKVIKWLASGAGMGTTIALSTGTYFMSRYCNDLGIRVDVMKVPVVVLALIHDSAKQSSFRASQTSDPSPKEFTKSDVQLPKIDEIIKELEQPTNFERENDLVRMDNTLTSRVLAIKKNFVKKLVDMDPLAPKEMIELANSFLEFFSQFPFDVDSLYFSVKDFIVQAYELACARQELNLCCSDFNGTQLLRKTSDCIQVLTEERNRLELLWLEVKKGLKAFDDEIEPLRSRLPVLEGERESKGAYFRNIKSNLEQTSKKLSDASNLMDELELASLFNSLEQSARLADLEAALGDARARLLS
ncbi:hypothetical protein LOK49_LG13G00893 [Camellia lanceoleosa]|uniref:Uncharacterized protein n=1 Tax=Camellia lanceoleosa TaxID=1840588 RepID=A0ACC0FKJ5_9ERIC|nr:hypothetical protein LOK49_LG13G00893 [Camellia lanceoleosa]